MLPDRRYSKMATKWNCGASRPLHWRHIWLDAKNSVHFLDHRYDCQSVTVMVMTFQNSRKIEVANIGTVFYRLWTWFSEIFNFFSYRNNEANFFLFFYLWIARNLRVFGNGDMRLNVIQLNVASGGYATTAGAAIVLARCGGFGRILWDWLQLHRIRSSDSI